MSAAKNWCSTLFVDSPLADIPLKEFGVADLLSLFKYEPEENFQYLLGGLEISPTTGKVHVQGYMQLLRKQRLLPVKRMFFGGYEDSVHLEIARGDHNSNLAYCKEDNNWAEWGLVSVAGARVDLNEIGARIRAGSITAMDVANTDFSRWCQYGRRFAEYETFLQPRRSCTPEVFVFWGETGMGKTRTAVRFGADLLTWAHGNCLHSYNNQPAVLQDRFV